MKIYTPRKPVGNSQFMLFCISVWDMLWNGKFPFIDTDSVKWKRSQTGYAAYAALPGTGGSGQGVSANFTGEWDPARIYSAPQIAIISLGSNAGTYVYINAVASLGNAPYAGGGFWVQLPMGQLGSWV